MINGQRLRILIDTGTSKNYVRPINVIKDIRKIDKPFKVNSVNGENFITHKCKINVLGSTAIFYLLPALKTFDGIIGCEFLHSIEALVDVKKKILFHKKGKDNIFYKKQSETNVLVANEADIPVNIKEKFEVMIQDNKEVFADSNRGLPFNTNVEATIEMTTNEPIYTRSYPYPVSVTKFVNSEIESLLKDGIIRKSSSAYNSPVNIVDKKGLDEYGNKKHRMVIDFRKINEFTVPDRYPIPHIALILSNLGKSKFFTTVDLKSGFHQILLAEKDREKTAFSVNNGKYEYCRLAVGLKNAPSIFQRAIDDILRDEIGDFCQVYMDDVIIYSPDEFLHLTHVDTVLKKLAIAGMRVNVEKTKFFKPEVEFLGFRISEDGIKTGVDKTKCILEYSEPKTLRALRSFLGLVGYYRRFIAGYAGVVKPLSKYLRGSNGNVGKKHSKKVNIDLDAEAKEAFQKVKKILASEDVLLAYPDYEKSFELTTDASKVAIAAVLSQEGRPITMISRTLSKAEESYATNERELLAIVWALKALRHYLYGVTNIKILTDHEPLTGSVSETNPNPKIRRWLAFVEEFAPQFQYKPGKENIVADALTRQDLNLLSESSDCTTVHSEVSYTRTVKTLSVPVNQFRNQIILSKSNHDSKKKVVLFQKFIRHLISFSNLDNLLDYLKHNINVNTVNAIHCDLPTLSEIQNRLIITFPGVKFIHTEKMVTDVTNKDDQLEIVTVEHNRAHRSVQENYLQIIDHYYFPKIKQLLKSIIKNCKICLENKYQRHPSKIGISETPIPDFPGQILHIDILITDKQHFLTCVDKFSKFSVIIPIVSRSVFKNTQLVVSDNEKAFKSAIITTFLRDNFSIKQHFVPPMHSKSNGQIERLHSTILEIARCLKAQQDLSDTKDLILFAVLKYNRTIHSVVKKAPIDIFLNADEKTLGEVKSALIDAQDATVTKSKNKMKIKTFNVGDKVFIKRNQRLGNKFGKVYVEGIVEKDLGTTVLINNRVVHKNNLR